MKEDKHEICLGCHKSKKLRESMVCNECHEYLVTNLCGMCSFDGKCEPDKMSCFEAHVRGK